MYTTANVNVAPVMVRLNFIGEKPIYSRKQLIRRVLAYLDFAAEVELDREKILILDDVSIAVENFRNIPQELPIQLAKLKRHGMSDVAYRIYNAIRSVMER